MPNASRHDDAEECGSRAFKTTPRAQDYPKRYTMLLPKSYIRAVSHNRLEVSV